jgi:hypothetical protein
MILLIYTPSCYNGHKCGIYCHVVWKDNSEEVLYLKKKKLLLFSEH